MERARITRGRHWPPLTAPVPPLRARGAHLLHLVNEPWDGLHRPLPGPDARAVLLQRLLQGRAALLQALADLPLVREAGEHEGMGFRWRLAARLLDAAPELLLGQHLQGLERRQPARSRGGAARGEGAARRGRTRLSRHARRLLARADLALQVMLLIPQVL